MRKYLILISYLLFSSAANAAGIVGWVFVDPVAGNDATCATQLSTNGAITPVPTLTVTPCRSFTKACTLLPADAGNWVVEGFPGQVIENVVCHASGHDPSNPLQIIGRNPGAGNGGPLYLKGLPGSNAPCFEMTGNYNYLNKIDFTGCTGDAFYVHGADANHLAVDDVLGYNTSFHNNKKRAIHADYTYWFLIFNNYIYDNASDPNTFESVLIEGSTFPLITNSGITNSGLSSTPPTVKVGVRFLQDIYPQYLFNTAMGGSSPDLELDDSFVVSAVRDPTKPVQQPFTYHIHSTQGSAAEASELLTDGIVGGVAQ